MIPGLYKIFQDRWVTSKGGTVWIISDTHFSDKELRAGIPGRPTDEELLANINSKVGKKDVLIHLGDVGNLDLARKLKGYKILIAGNHDAGKTNYEDIFDEVYTGPLMIGEKLILSHEPIDIPFALNIHGHVHDPKARDKKNQLNVCADRIHYQPINLNTLMKKGLTAKIETIHRTTIDKATQRKRKLLDKF